MPFSKAWSDGPAAMEKSLVILSDRNHRVHRYVATHGDYVLTPSRHSVVTGGTNGVAERHQITINRDPSAPGS